MCGLTHTLPVIVDSSQSICGIRRDCKYVTAEENSQACNFINSISYFPKYGDIQYCKELRTLVISPCSIIEDTHLHHNFHAIILVKFCQSVSQHGGMERELLKAFVIKSGENNRIWSNLEKPLPI